MPRLYPGHHASTAGSRFSSIANLDYLHRDAATEFFGRYGALRGCQGTNGAVRKTLGVKLLRSIRLHDQAKAALDRQVLCGRNFSSHASDGAESERRRGHQR
jgi:hypothetical protein